MRLHKDLNEKEAESFRRWARDNYKRLEPIDGTWHPVTQAECVKMNGEAALDPTTLDVVAELL